MITPKEHAIDFLDWFANSEYEYTRDSIHGNFWYTLKDGQVQEIELEKIYNKFLESKY